MKSLAHYANLARNFDSIDLSGKFDLVKICDLGRDLKDDGFDDEANRCYEIVVKCMLQALGDGRIDLALNIESMIYSAFVKSTEKEEHYFNCFKSWSSQFQEKARSLKLPELKYRKNNKVCFVIQVGVLLGHTEVMLRVVKEWRKANRNVEVYVAATARVQPGFVELMKSNGITFLHYCGDNLDVSPPPGQALHSLRNHLQQLEIYSVVWVSVPLHASYALSLPLAPQQVLWSLKFHPVYVEEVNHHVCGGNVNEKTRRYHGREWDVCPFPLTVTLKANTAKSITEIRDKYPKNSVLLGTLAREDKFNSFGFLSSVGSLLTNNPNCHFLFTGREVLPRVRDAFRAYGVEDRCHFVGWVDTNLYAEALDIFLETFPFGCGVTGFQSMGHGTPLLSFEATDTLYGYQLKGGLGDDFEKISLDRNQGESLPILTAVNLHHYIELAQRLIDDPLYRAEISLREKTYYESESALASEYADKLLHLIRN